jgi:hypothetical protein
MVRFASQKAQLASQYATKDMDLGELTRRILLADHAELQGADAFVTSSAELKAMERMAPTRAQISCRPKRPSL